MLKLLRERMIVIEFVFKTEIRFLKERKKFIQNNFINFNFAAKLILIYPTTSVSAHAYYFKLMSFYAFVQTERAYYPRGRAI